MIKFQKKSAAKIERDKQRFRDHLKVIENTAREEDARKFEER